MLKFQQRPTLFIFLLDRVVNLVKSLNLRKFDQRLQAFAETVNKVDISGKGFDLQSIPEHSENTEVHYDDYLFITIGGYVVIGSNGQATELTGSRIKSLMGF